MEQLSAVNLAVRFAVELCAVAAFAYWGVQVAQVVFFALAAVAFAAAGQETFAWIIGAVAAVDTALVYILPANAFQEH